MNKNLMELLEAIKLYEEKMERVKNGLFELGKIIDEVKSLIGGDHVQA